MVEGGCDGTGPSLRDGAEVGLAARLFLALWPSPRTRSALAAVRDGLALPPGAVPVRDDKLHLTLHFIGAVPAGRVAAVADGLARPCPSFTLVLDQVETWPRGLALLAPGRVPPALARLHGELADALRALALPVETRAFRPHVTLARRAGPPQPRRPCPPVEWRVRGYTLVRSRPDGRFELLRRYG